MIDFWWVLKDPQIIRGVKYIEQITFKMKIT